MGEAGIEGLIGGESEAEASVEGAPNADPVALAVAMDAAKHDPELARKAGNYLDEQLALVRLQVRHFDEERRLAIAAAKRKRYADRFRNGLITFVAGLAACALIAAAVMVWNAFRDHGLVVEAFSVPPDLNEQGVSGRVVAAELIDQINLLQSQTRTARPASSFRNNWGDDIKVEIPETGVSVGELSRILHEQFGSATRIDGEVTHTQTGLSIVARLPAEPALRVTGEQTDLSTLIQRLAEQAYASTQPYRYGVFLSQHGRHSEALALFRDLAEHGPNEERPWALAGVGNESAELSGYEDALAAWNESLRLDPNQAVSSTNIALVSRGVGLDEETLTESKRYQTLSPSALAQHFTAPAIAYGNSLMMYLAATEMGDHESGIQFARSMVTDSQFQAGAEKAYSAFAREEMALNHEAVEIEGGISDAEATVGLIEDSDYYVVMPNVLAAFERGDMSKVEALSSNLINELSKPGIPVVFRQQILRRIYPVLAEAFAREGRHAEAEALLKEVPNNSYDGWRTRGRIATLRRDFATGEQAFAEAVRRAPSIPRAYSDWGDLLAAKGDIPGALARYAEAHSRGPRSADPLKRWGDLLLSQGNIKDALAKYDEALKYAPNWKQLKDARDALAKQKV
jgi:tetratricopeptide (TPR) repeat protein